MSKRDQETERAALAKQAETPLCPHETDGFVNLRAKCSCGSTVGRVELRGGQYVVNCADCSAYAFCAPKALLGIPNEAPKPVRIASRYDGKCKRCRGEFEMGNWVFFTPGEKGVVCSSCNNGGGL